MNITEQSPSNYIVLVNGIKRFGPFPTRQLAESAIMQNIPLTEQSTASIQLVDERGSQLLFG
jgi:hypothetical protein